MSYSADTFVADEQPTTAKWNKLWSNDASFNDGSGIADNAVINRHIAEGVIAMEKMNATVAFEAYHSTTQAMGSGAFAQMSFDSETYDYGADFASSTFVAPVDGIYYFACRSHVSVVSGGTLNRAICALYTNTSGSYAETLRGTDASGTLAAGQSILFSGVVRLTAGNGARIYSFGNTAHTLSANLPNTYFSGYLVAEV